MNTFLETVGGIAKGRWPLAFEPVSLIPAYYADEKPESYLTYVKVPKPFRPQRLIVSRHYDEQIFIAKILIDGEERNPIANPIPAIAFRDLDLDLGLVTKQIEMRLLNHSNANILVTLAILGEFAD